MLAGPVDVREVADRLIPPATNDPAGRVPDLGGPAISPVADLARAWLSATGKRRAVLPVRVPGTLGANLRAGAQLTTEHADGRVTSEQYWPSGRGARTVRWPGREQPRCDASRARRAGRPAGSRGCWGDARAGEPLCRFPGAGHAWVALLPEYNEAPHQGRRRVERRAHRRDGGSGLVAGAPAGQDRAGGVGRLRDPVHRVPCDAPGGRSRRRMPPRGRSARCCRWRSSWRCWR